MEGSSKGCWSVLVFAVPFSYGLCGGSFKRFFLLWKVVSRLKNKGVCSSLDLFRRGC